MVQVRHLLLGLASGSALYSGMVSALGLGDITLHSALNQPLEADIELLEVGDLTASDMKVRLATDDVFNRSGVDRIYFLNDLRFTPLLRGGKSVIRVVSSKPVREPYLNFIVELARPNGQLYREYTILLDPPNGSAYNTVAATPAAAALPSKKSSAASTPAAPAKPKVVPPAKLGKRYVVATGDSLWTIAARLRAQGSTSSQQALMADIHALNPQAFGGADMSRLQVGANLLLPDGAPVATTPTADTAEPPATLSVVGDDELPATPAPTAPLDPQAEMIVQMQRRLDNELAQRADENTKLQQSVADLQVQVQQLMEQSAAKTQQLDQLKAQLNAQPAPAPADQSKDGTAQLPGATPQAADNDSWSSAIWGFLALLLAALLGLLFWRRRRPEPELQSAAVAPPMVSDDDEFDLQERFVPEVALAPVAPAPRVQVAVAEPRPASPSDTLEGANIYIAYGRFSEAAASLRRALDAEPQRVDIRFRLLEVLAQLGDLRGFQREEEILLDSGYADAPITQLKARHPELFERAQAPEPEPDMSLDLDVLDDAVLVLDDAPPLASKAPAEDDQFNLDDFSLDPDWDIISPFSATARSKAEAAQKASNDSVQDASVAKANDDLSPLTGSAMLVEETHDEGWFGEGVDDGVYLSQPAVEDELVLGDLDHLQAHDHNLSKFNQALAYIDQGNLENACDILNELINEGDEEQRLEASRLLAKIA